VHGEPPHPPPPTDVRLAGFLWRDANPRSTSRYVPCFLLAVRQGTSQQWTDPLAGYRELSNSHELSMLHPTRLSLSTSGATPQAAPGYRKLVEWYISQEHVCELSRKCPPCGAEGARAGCARLLTRASQTGPGTVARIADRSLKPSEPVPSLTEYRRHRYRGCSNVSLSPCSTGNPWHAHMRTASQ
jgi:hypothetical protein